MHFDANAINSAKAANPANAQPVAGKFLPLESPRQDMLLLYGPRQRYQFEKGMSIPCLQGDDELLIQVFAIGLNPFDRKGPDYDFGPPSYPAEPPPRTPSRIQSGDVVFGPSTDNRDARKGAYQEYVVIKAYNVARGPATFSVNVGAAIDVAFTFATIGIGISLGVNLSVLSKAGPSGPDLFQLVRLIDHTQFPEDVRAEVSDHIAHHERLKPGDWLVIWGGSSATGLFALHLAKLACLKVISIADVAKNGARLIACGADMIIDRFDQDRAVEIIYGITGDALRFAVDLICDTSAGHPSHLEDPTTAPNVQQHTVPIKIFRGVPAIGESFFIAKTLEMPEVELAGGGLSGINACAGKRCAAVSSVASGSLSLFACHRPPALPHRSPPASV
ncbi:hypothetical protein FB451DRAFT_1452837 [Mycena latifolia]|nr:hypothetical protein FB451DRAFT_1452837 [Mycena latifolia]